MPIDISNLSDLIFREILKINPSIIAKYITIQDQVLYLILIPHVLLFLFLFAFSRGIVARVVGAHRGLQYLTGLVAYIYVIYAGWYGSLIPFFIGWLSIALILGLFLFFISIIWHPAAAASGGRLVGAIAKSAAQKVGKSREIEKLTKELEYVESQMRKYENKTDDASRTIYNQYEERRKALIDKIEELGG